MMSNFNETTPIDDWGAEHAPRLVENIDTHLAVLCAGLTDDQRYTARRLIMFTMAAILFSQLTAPSSI